MRTRYTTYRRLLHARTSTKRLRLATSGPPRHAPPTTPRRPLRQQRAKRTLPALRPAALAPRQLQREEEGVAVSLRYRRRCPPQRRSLACRHPWGRRRRAARLGTRNPARHCQLRVGNQRLGLHWGGAQKQGGGTDRLGRRARAAHLTRRKPNSTRSKRMSKIRKSSVENEVDVAHSSPSRKSTPT